MEYAGGKRLFVDFAGDRMSWYDAERKSAIPVEVFVSALGASGLIYAEATPGQDLESWLMAHVRAFASYGGVREAVVPDNLKSGVTRACWYDPDLNPAYLELARRFDTVILPTRAGKARDKAAVETAVQVVERWVIAPLRNRRFFSLGELNRAVRERVDEINRRCFRGMPTSRQDLFEEVERAALHPLPPQRYEVQTIKRATVNIDYHVEFDGHLYSVPYRLVKEKVELWSSQLHGRDPSPRTACRLPPPRLRQAALHHQARAPASVSSCSPGVEPQPPGPVGGRQRPLRRRGGRGHPRLPATS